MMSLPAKTQVLIVGAGPSGVACAIALIRLGVQVTIVDALKTPKYGGRASLIHPRTLEVLDSIGLARPLLDAGSHSKGVFFFGGKNKLISVDFTEIRDDTKFGVLLLLAQHDTEAILRNALAREGLQVFRNRTVVGIKQLPADGLEVTFEDGATIRAPYVVGADGARSIVRQTAGISFRDPHSGTPYDRDVKSSSTLQILLSDVYFAEPLPSSIPRDAVSWYLNKPLLLVPLPFPSDSELGPKSASLWRIGIIIPLGSPLPPRHPDLAYLQREVDERNPWGTKVTIAALGSAASYRVRSAVADTFFKRMGSGNILLTGDAAHVHSPSGGQGMNLGLCDAVALGAAIRSHMDENVNVAEPGLQSDLQLVNYSASRQKTAIRVIGFVKKMTTAVNADSAWRRTLRNAVLWIAGCMSCARRAAAWRMSGLINRGS